MDALFQVHEFNTVLILSSVLTFYQMAVFYEQLYFYYMNTVICRFFGVRS